MKPVAPLPAAGALRRFPRRLMPTSLSSAQLADMDRAILDRSLFSARNTYEDVLAHLQERMIDIVSPRQERRPDRVTSENPEGWVTVAPDAGQVRLETQALLAGHGYDPGEKRGTIEDLSAAKRIDLVLDMNVSEAQAYGHLLQNADADFADAFPAQELVRTEERKEPRDWAVLWQSAAAEAGDAAAARAHRLHGRMVARKDSPIWVKLSRFGRAWPPFDYGSGMGLEDTTREEAMDLGVIDRDTQVQVDIPRFEGELA